MRELSLCYPAKITHDSDGYYVEFIDLNAFSEADSLDEAIFNAQEALDVTLLGLVDLGYDIPAPSKSNGDGIYNIPASPDVAVPVMLYKSRKEGGKTISAVAKCMDVSLQRYHDIEKGRNITLKTLKRAAAALGATVEIKFNFNESRQV